MSDENPALEQRLAAWDEQQHPERPRKLELTKASDIRPRRVRWLWDERIAMGTLALLAGREGLGKSTLAYAIAAQVTRGELGGEYLGQPKAVLVCAAEDSWEHTIVPRLIAAKADLDLVYRVEVLTDEGIHLGLSLPKDNRATEDAARQTGAALLILDPLISRLGSLDTHRDAEVRQALEPLVRVADRAGMAVLGLIHHNKSSSTDPLQLVMGSKAFTAVARSVHTVILDPDDSARRLFGTPKNNLGRSDMPTLAFTVESYGVPTEDGTAWTGRIEWLGEHEGSIAEAMQQSTGTAGTPNATQKAKEWLLEFLTAKGGSCDSATVKDEARKARISEATIKRAKLEMSLGDTRGGFQGRTTWWLPDHSAQTAPAVGSDPSRLNVLGEREK